MEATAAESTKDYRHKISISRKEAKETKYWLRMLSHTNNESRIFIKPLIVENEELIAILSRIVITIDNDR
jgi:four helix bundle protein